MALVVLSINLHLIKCHKKDELFISSHKTGPIICSIKSREALAVIPHEVYNSKDLRYALDYYLLRNRCLNVKYDFYLNDTLNQEIKLAHWKLLYLNNDAPFKPVQNYFDIIISNNRYINKYKLPPLQSEFWIDSYWRPKYHNNTSFNSVNLFEEKALFYSKKPNQLVKRIPNYNF